ncbi:hypothetical protein AHAS_Ahas13G0161000 [Arachis hypogaea]
MRWHEDIQISKGEFSHVPIWIQIWDLLEYYKIKELRRKVGEAIGKVIDIGFFSVKGIEEKIIKIQINIDVTKPLQRMLKNAGKNKKALVGISVQENSPQAEGEQEEVLSVEKEQERKLEQQYIITREDLGGSEEASRVVLEDQTNVQALHVFGGFNMGVTEG